MHASMNCIACSVFKRVLVGWEQEDLISVICRMSVSIDWNDHGQWCASAVWAFSCVSPSSRGKCLAVSQIFQTLSCFFGSPGPKTMAVTEEKKSTKSLPISTHGDLKWILQMRWGMCTNRGWQSLLSHWSLAWGCVYTVNFNKVSLCVLCRDFYIDVFSALVP